ncbi:MAG: ABC transporter permease [Prevotella sp.]|nr:ABC transporter permease [Prevotella sp.]MDY5666471.1 ABC transporter permease [Alloprevotella sp.]
MFNIRQAFADFNYIFREELKTIIRDKGVIIFFFLVPLGYPLLYTFIYTNEVVRDVPIAVVDDCRSAQSRAYLRHIDATPDVHIISYCANMGEAKQLIKHRNAYGAVYIPRDFTDKLNRGEQVYVSAFADMSGMLYYKSVLTANTNVSLAMNADIKVKRAGGTTMQQDQVAEHPIKYEEVSLYNPQNGFATFLIPAVLMLIIQQTLLLGVGMAAGTAREHNAFRNLVPVERHHRGLLRIVMGKGFAYLLVYIPLTIYILGVVPHLFRLNQIGNPWDILLFVTPFLIACILFSMMVSAFVRHREMCIMLIVFTSVPLLFISGLSWPGSAVPSVWKAISYVFPSTFGIDGFVAINNMGADLSDVKHEWYMLWMQAFIYLIATCAVYKASITRARQRVIEKWRSK